MDSFLHENIAEKPQKHHQASSPDMMSSAKVIMEAAQLTMRHETEKVDKGRVAGAAADLLDAASHYGKLEEKSFGKYVEKAETYLHSYQSSHSTGGGGIQNPNPNTTGGHDHSKPHTHSSGSGSGSGSESESGFNDYFKMAEGFLKKH